MPCWKPLQAYRSRVLNPETGRYGVTFNPVKGLVEGSSLVLPCGRCMGCRIEKSRQWALRCLHESQMHERNCFITLTYDDDHVPIDYSVKLRDWQLFMKRLRFDKGTKAIRFFACGEYGDRLLRPHYHALLFNCDFADKELRQKRGENRVYTSKTLAKLWPFGSHEIGDVSFKSAAYVARYVIKKQNGDHADRQYYRASPVDGLFYRVKPEFAVMSRRPGLGTTWFAKFRTDAFPSDFLVVDGRKVKPPKFYLEKLAEPEALPITRARKRFAVKNRANSTPARLAVREEVQAAKLKRLQRTME
ncbi:MAG: replication initiator protein [Microvirus sp.]|nr:MAG: replication initiator protein [Microvirus sp.]